MAWLESHEDIADHKKTQKLCSLLKIPVPTAVGHLHLLWHYTLRVAWQTGDLTDHQPEFIARGCHWTGRPEVFLKAIQAAGYMDGMKVHDWELYARELIYQRSYNRNKRKTAEKHVENSCNTAKKPPLPNPTLPNPTLKESPASPDPSKQIDLKSINLKGQSEGVKHKIFNRLVDTFRQRGWRDDSEYVFRAFKQISLEMNGYDPKDFFPYFKKVAENYINKNSEAFAADAKIKRGQEKKIGIHAMGVSV